LPDVKLQLGQNRPGPGQPWFNALRVVGKNLVIRREHDRELFQCYELESGAFKQATLIDHERFDVSFPSLVWTAGQAVPLTLQFDAGGRTVKPRWRVWARPLESAAYREFKLTGDKLEVPADCAGLYRVKVTPEAAAAEREGFARGVHARESHLLRPGRGDSGFCRCSRCGYGGGEGLAAGCERESGRDCR
jgi:hypothetical protein